MDQNATDMLEALNFIKERMVTKEDLLKFATKEDLEKFATKDEVREIVREEASDIRAELTSIRRDLEALTEKVDNIVGLPKEIDYALERIAAIERHLGINEKIAA